MAKDSDNILKSGLDNLHGPFSGFIRAQKTASLALLCATMAALWWANSDFSMDYQDLIETPVGFYVGSFDLRASLHYIINDGLMVIFFFMLGLEMKREVLAGDFARPESRRMLVLCAVGGMVCPALIYSLSNWSQDSRIGWGIPMATDTAFALGALILVRKHVPASLLAFVVGLAIVDDVGAIVVIAIFYTREISASYLAGSFAFITLLAIANYAGIRKPLFYIVVGIAAWWTMLKSGVHPTVAGVAIAMTIPARPERASGKLLAKEQSIISTLQQKQEGVDVLGSKHDHERVMDVRDLAERAGTPLRRWEDILALPVGLFILPLFALANAGIVLSFDGLIESLRHPVGLGIVTGLIFGKLLGISGACWLGLRLNIGSLPQGVTLKHVVGVSLMSGIGFTMSTFIAALGFDARPEYLHHAKTAILVASIFCAIVGLVYLRVIATREKTDPPTHSLGLADSGDEQPDTGIYTERGSPVSPVRPARAEVRAS